MYVYLIFSYTRVTFILRRQPYGYSGPILILFSVQAKEILTTTNHQDFHQRGSVNQSIIYFNIFSLVQPLNGGFYHNLQTMNIFTYKLETKRRSCSQQTYFTVLHFQQIQSSAAIFSF